MYGPTEIRMTEENEDKALLTEWPEMDDPALLDQIIEVMSTEGMIDRDKITPEATLDTLGVESMDVVMILMGLEEKLGVYLPMDSDMASARNLAEFMQAILKAMKASSENDAAVEA